MNEESTTLPGVIVEPAKAQPRPSPQPRPQADADPHPRTGTSAAARSALAVLLAGQLMALLDVTIVNVAMPTIAHKLSATSAQLQLLVVGYTVSYAVLLITGARLGQVFGRRRVYLGGVLVFTAASLACGLAPNADTLLIARFLEGVGAAAMVPQVISIIQTAFTGQARVIGLSAYSAVLGGGFVVGQVLGGVLVTADLFGWSWRPVFLVNVPIGVVIMLLAPRLLPADTPRDAPARQFDVRGLILAAVAVFAVMLPLVLGHQDGWPAWTWASMAAGAVIAAVFVLLERTAPAPLLPPQVLHAAGFRTGQLSIFCIMSAYGSLLFTLSLYFQDSLHYSAIEAAGAFAPSALVFGVVSLMCNRLPQRWHKALLPLAMSAMVVSVGGVALTFAMWSAADGIAVGAILVLYGLGAGVGFSLLLARSLARVPVANAGDASGLMTTTMQLGQSVGVAAIGGVFLNATVGDAGHAIAAASGWEAVLLAVAALAAFLVAGAGDRAAAAGVNRGAPA